MSRSWMAFGAASLALAVVLPATSAGAAAAKPSPWVQQAELTDGMPSNDNGHFGGWTAIQGKTAVVSAPDETGPHGGNVYVFDRGSAGHWVIKAVLRGNSGPSTSSFGQSLGLLGNTIVVGSWGAGCAFVFRRSPAGAWSQVAVLKPSDGVPGNSFGFSVAISTSGILVGDPARDDWRGAVFAFAESNGAWRQTAELLTAAREGGTGVSACQSVLMVPPRRSAPLPWAPERGVSSRVKDSSTGRARLANGPRSPSSTTRQSGRESLRTGGSRHRTRRDHECNQGEY